MQGVAAAPLEGPTSPLGTWVVRLLVALCCSDRWKLQIAAGRTGELAEGCCNLPLAACSRLALPLKAVTPIQKRDRCFGFSSLQAGEKGNPRDAQLLPEDGAEIEQVL